MDWVTWPGIMPHVILRQPLRKLHRRLQLGNLARAKEVEKASLKGKARTNHREKAQEKEKGKEKVEVKAKARKASLVWTLTTENGTMIPGTTVTNTTLGTMSGPTKSGRLIPGGTVMATRGSNTVRRKQAVMKGHQPQLQRPPQK